MSRSLLKTDFDYRSFVTKLEKASKGMEGGQKQAVKRWGVQVAREMAMRTEPWGKKSGGNDGQLKKAMYKDAFKVLWTVDKKIGRKGKAANSVGVEVEGRRFRIKNNRFLHTKEEVVNWINQNRTRSRKRTRMLPKDSRKVCTMTVLKQAINYKFKKWGGLAKDGWLDAGHHLSRGQKGSNPERIGASLMKWARKDVKVGIAKEGSRNFKSFGKLINMVSYVSDKYMLSDRNKRFAIKIGSDKVLKWYKRELRRQNSKRK